jgi:signal transduction histidine kinase
VAADFLDKHPPRPDGLGQQATRDKQVKFLPDPAQDHDELELVRQRPDLARHGIRAMAAFPLFVGEKTGVLYLHFHRPYRFLEQEVRWVELLASRAADAIRHATAYTELRDRARQLTTLRSVVEDLVGELADAGLLLKIARNTLNILAADVVTIYEYNEREHRFLTPPAMAGRLRQVMKMQTEISAMDAPALLVEAGDDVFADGTVAGHPILNPRTPEGELRQDSFALRESIESAGGVLLRVRNEIVGVLFVNYRRLHRFSPEECDIIRALSSAAAIAIRNRRVLEKRQEDLMTITHNLQSPLDAVSSALDDLHDRSVPADELDDRALAHVPRSFHEDIEHALALNEDVLLMSSGILRAFAHEMGVKWDLNPRPINVPEELRQLCKRLLQANSQPHLQFDYQTQPGFPEIRLDREIFSIVMYNLVHNALKYSSDDTTVRIVCRYDRALSSASVEVRSTGERIEESEREKIFEKFRKASTIERTGRHHSGVGLGLWAAREAIRAADGELRLELSGEEPQEAAFIVEIPITG